MGIISKGFFFCSNPVAFSCVRRTIPCLHPFVNRSNHGCVKQFQGQTKIAFHDCLLMFYTVTKKELNQTKPKEKKKKLTKETNN